MYKSVLRLVKERYNESGLVLALGATLASIMLSGVFKFVPCELCWYQRILMWPMAIIFFVALLLKDKRSHLYALPFALLGSLVALYQSFIQWGVIGDPDSCSLIVSCADAQVKLLGIFTIPFGSFLVFAAISALTVLKLRQEPIKFAKRQISLTLNISLLLLALALVFILIRRAVI